MQRIIHAKIFYWYNSLDGRWKRDFILAELKKRGIIMNIFKAVVCKVKGHVVDPEKDNIIFFQTAHLNSRNWICKCKRCGVYIMHDGALSGMSVTISKKEAFKIKKEYERDMIDLIGKRLERMVKNENQPQT